MATACRILFALAFLSTHQVIAQKHTSNWVLGFECGLSFQTGVPKGTMGSSVRTLHGSAVISDRKTGELLFYTDGRNFWNRNHQLMVNAHTLPYSCTSLITQPAIIIPSQGDENQYHVYCIRPIYEVPPSNAEQCIYATDQSQVPEGQSGLGLYYYMIDMRLNGGLGNVVEEVSNVLLQINITEKLTAIPHTNGTDYWVIVHGWKNNTFYAYQSREGEIVNIVTSNIGSVHGGYGGVYVDDELKGEIKASPDGKKIASAVFSDYRPFDLFDFDAETGMLLNYINLGNIKGQYGVSFSPDNSKLYVSSDGRDESSELLFIIMQFDLDLGDSIDILESGKSIIINNPDTNIPSNGIFDGWSAPEKGMALGLDGRLYISGNTFFGDQTGEGHILVVAEKPNKAGFECDINFKTFEFGDGKTGIGLPNFIQSDFNELLPVSECNQPSAIKVYPNPTRGPILIDFLEGCTISYSLAVFNSLGQLVHSAEVSSDIQLKMEDLSSGVYFLRFESVERGFVKRIVKF